MVDLILGILVAVVALVTTVFGQGPVDRVANLTQRLCPQATVIIEQVGGVVDAAAQAEVEVVPGQVWASARAICDYFAAEAVAPAE
jgi:hypothetical protein